MKKKRIGKDFNVFSINGEYKGKLISEDRTTYTIEDFTNHSKDQLGRKKQIGRVSGNIIIFPKATTILEEPPTIYTR